MSRVECIANGTRFYSPQEYRYAIGDLFRCDYVFIFNANVLDSNIQWIEGAPPASDKILTCETGWYFEKRGVIVVSYANVKMNSHLTEYIKPDRLSRWRGGI